MPGFFPPMERSPTPLVVLDTESATRTGAPHLVELGAVRVVDGEAQDHFEALVCPAVPVEPEATEVHGLTDEDLRTAPEGHAVLEEFFAWIGDAVLVAHAARSDAQTLGFASARAGVTPPGNRLVDSLPLARKAFPEAPDHRLPTLAEHLDLEVTTLHRALPDAVACWQVFEAALARLDERDVTEARLIALCGVPETIATSLPARPNRKPAHLRVLERARSEEATVVLTYGERGSEPARLHVEPRLLYRGREKSYLEGVCQSSGLLKTYRMDRIHRIETT